MHQAGFEPTTNRLEGERHTPELKICLKNLGKNWWIVFPRKFEKSQLFPNEIWKISVFSAGCRHFWIFFMNLDWFNNFASKRSYEVSWCINFKIFCAHISAGCRRNEKMNVNSKQLFKIPNMVKIWWTVHFFHF